MTSVCCFHKHGTQAALWGQEWSASWLWVGVWHAEGFWVICKCIWKGWPCFALSSSGGSICGSHSPIAGLSHAPAPEPDPAQRCRGNPSPAGSTWWASTSQIVSPTSDMPKFWAWRPGYGQTSVKSPASPRNSSPCSANIFRTTCTCLSAQQSIWITACSGKWNKGFSSEKEIGKNMMSF